MHINGSIIFLFCLPIFLNFTHSFAQAKTNEYAKYLDSAEHTYEESPELAKLYLDSVPEPVEVSIKGNLANYYRLKGLLSDRLNNTAELYQNFLMALKYAKTENNYDIAGMASVDLFYNNYFIKKDSTSFRFLKDAETFFKKANNSNGLAEVQQMYAYVELYKQNYDKSNALILEHLPAYKNIKDDGYYYMYALFMLSSNYIHQEDLYNSHTYFNRLKNLERDTTISKYLLDVHKVSINNCIADYHASKKAMDSTQYYLKKSEKLRYAMNNSDVELYFKLYADYYEHLEYLEGKARYVDSLANFESELLGKNLTASLKINESLEKSENQLATESTKKRYIRNLAIILFAVVGVLFIAFIIGYKKFNKRIRDYIKKENKSSYLKSSHEKLKVKVVGLEQYILKIKDEMKKISSINNPSEARKEIKELYKNIHLKSATELTNGESHLELINDLNSKFFIEIKEVYPELSESEIIMCYYIVMGFKNKEIASFLNVSIRSVEGKRYRISKKLNVNSKQINLVEHLQDKFKIYRN